MQTQRGTGSAMYKAKPKYFYKYVGNKSTVGTNIGPLKDQKGRIAAEPEKKSNALSQHYHCIYSKPLVSIVVKHRRSYFVKEMIAL